MCGMPDWTQLLTIVPMTPRKYPAFKDTQFFDWDSEPALERESNVFRDDSVSSRRVPCSTRQTLRGAWVVACGLGVGALFVALIELVPLLHHRLVALG